MNIVFFGAGKRGREIATYFEKVRTEEENCIGFVDNYSKEQTFCGYPIITVEEAEKSNAAIVISVARIYTAMEIYMGLRKKFSGDIYWFAKNRFARGSESSFLKKECVSCAEWSECMLPQVEMHVSDICNLNCKGCAHFSPIFKDPCFEIEGKLRDVKLLKEKFSHIMYFYILGGEPLLNPKLDVLIKEIRKILPTTELRIVTNGLLIPGLSQKILKSIKDNSVVVSISEYEPTHNCIDLITKRLDEYAIEYEIRAFDRKQKFNKPLSLSSESKYNQKCISNGCVNIWNGKISRCPTLMYIEKFNEVFETDLPADGIWSLEECPSGEELLQLLKQEVPLCKHCVDNEIEWQRCGKEVSISDFAVEE